MTTRTFIPWINLGDSVRIPDEDGWWTVIGHFGTMFGDEFSEDKDWMGLVLTNEHGGMVMLDSFPVAEDGFGSMVPVLEVFQNNGEGCA